MTNYTKIALALFALTIVGLGVPMANAANDTGILYQYSNGMVTLETESISIKVMGNDQAPHFMWWNTSDPVTDYKVMFVKMFEATDVDENGVYNPSTSTMIGEPFTLPTLGWQFTDFTTGEEGAATTEVHFGFNTTSGDTTIAINIHIFDETPNQFKFDIIVENWDWSDVEGSLLVVMFTENDRPHAELGDNPDPTPMVQNQNRFTFNNAFFEYAESAEADGNLIDVKASCGDGNAIFLAFENFAGENILVYDPILGISSSETIVSLDPITIGLVGGIAIIAMLAIVLIRRR